MGIVNFAQQQDYDNIEEFAAAISKSVIKKFQAPS
jgi:dihydroneopterin aldolase